MPPAQECKQWNVSLYTDCESSTENICSEYDEEQLSKIDEYTPKWAPKYLKMPLSRREGAVKSFFSDVTLCNNNICKKYCEAVEWFLRNGGTLEK